MRVEAFGVVLRGYRPGDVPDVLAAFADMEIARWNPGPAGPGAAEFMGRRNDWSGPTTRHGPLQTPPTLWSARSRCTRSTQTRLMRNRLLGCAVGQGERARDSRWQGCRPFRVCSARSAPPVPPCGRQLGLARWPGQQVSCTRARSASHSGMPTASTTTSTCTVSALLTPPRRTPVEDCCADGRLCTGVGRMGPSARQMSAFSRVSECDAVCRRTHHGSPRRRANGRVSSR